VTSNKKNRGFEEGY